MYVVGKGPTYLWNMSALTGINISVTFLCYGTILLVLKLRKTIIVTQATIEITKTIALPFLPLVPVVTNAVNPKDPRSLVKAMYVSH